MNTGCYESVCSIRVLFAKCRGLCYLKDFFWHIPAAKRHTCLFRAFQIRLFVHLCPWASYWRKKAKVSYTFRRRDTGAARGPNSQHLQCVLTFPLQKFTSRKTQIIKVADMIILSSLSCLCRDFKQFVRLQTCFKTLWTSPGICLCTLSKINLSRSTKTP